jgi:tRNA (guanine-N7-)-methyltransferase
LDFAVALFLSPFPFSAAGNLCRLVRFRDRSLGRDFTTVPQVDRASLVNPYVRWVHDHPERLLPDPTPAALARLRAAVGGPPVRVLVDLGCGSGQFLLGLGARHPEDDCIGFEVRYKRLVKSARKLERGRLARVWLVREAAERFGEYFPPGSVDLVFVNFPDPWPKRSQWKKRLINQGFLQELERVLKPSGRLCLKTDHGGYFLHSLTMIQARPGWHTLDWSNDLHRRPRPMAGCPEAGVETEFEQLFRSKGKAVFAAIFARSVP